MNAANLCPSPILVMEIVFQYIRDEDRDASFQNREKHTELKERKKLAQLMGASPDEIALVRNTSEANNTAVNSMNLGAGDEVLLWDQNHPTNNVAWKVRATRHGFAVKYVSLDSPPGSVDQIVETFKKVFTPRTKVLVEKYGVAGAGGGGPNERIRLCPHIYNSIREVEKVCSASFARQAWLEIFWFRGDVSA